MADPSLISLTGARTNNLKNLSVEIPLQRLTVVCGVSGSGKTSLAFDTLFAEAQRRYLETLSPQVRQQIHRLEKPDVDQITNLPPAVAVRQQVRSADVRATVGTATSAWDYLALLFARLGEIVCFRCGTPVRRDTPTSALDVLRQLPELARFQIAFPVTGEEEDWTKTLQKDGFDRVIAAGKTWNLRSEKPPADPGAGWVVVDRLSASSSPQRILDSLEMAFASGKQQCLALVECNADAIGVVEIDQRFWQPHRFSSELRCGTCGEEYLTPEPRLFRFTSPLGACPACQGGGFSSTDAGAACPDCHGQRLNPHALAVRIQGRNIAELAALPGDELREIHATLATDQPHLESLGQQLTAILDYLHAVGLGYLSLDRRMPTLSAGEAQRVLLTRVLGTPLVNTLYVLDEPSAGLHPRDQLALFRVITQLGDNQNTLVVVEHHPDLLNQADHILEIGPGAGEQGGEVVFAGSYGELQQADTLTARSLRGSLPSVLPQDSRGQLTLHSARTRTLRDLTLEFPLGQIVAIAGVSGSGKSTLLEDTLYPAVCAELGQTCPVPPGEYSRLEGTAGMGEVLLVDRQPVGQNARSVPATFLNVFDEIRQVFAATGEAKARNFTPSHFSFNSARGGRCPRCQGLGEIKLDLQFLSDVRLVCSECDGSRYQRDVLEAKYRNSSIADVLRMNAREAFPFFRGQPKVQKHLHTLKEVGLDYLPLGQPAPTLSGGESQRLKIAARLASATENQVLFLMDEPSQGLHPADVQQLLACFRHLLSVGHSLIITEHNPRMIAQADWIIELGPGAGEQGGQLIATGTPADLKANPESITGRYLP